MAETVPTKSALKGSMRRVSIWGEDFGKESDSGQVGARNAMKKRRLSRASFKDPMATEDIGTSRTTRSTIASALARMTRKMSLRSTVMDSSARSLLPEEKSTLFMVSVAFAAILCSVIAAVLLLVVSRSDPAAQVACRSRKCVQFMKQLRAVVNDNQDPCLDFYRYVCGHWMDGGGSFFGDNANASLVGLARAMRSPESEFVDDREGTSVLLHVFGACQDYVFGEWTLQAALEEVDRQLSLFALRGTSTFNDVIRSFLKTALETGLESVVIIGVVRVGSEALLHLSSGKSLVAMFQVLHDRQELNDLVVAVLKAFPDVSSHAKTAEMLFNIDFDVSVIVDDDQRYLEAKVSFSEVFEHAVKGVDVQDWLEYFNEILPPSRQLNSSSDLVLTTGLDQIRKSLSVITSYGVQKAGLYLSAYLAMHAAWMESVRLKVKHDDLRTALFCMNVTRHVLRQSWPQLTAKLIPVPREAAAVVEAVFESVKKASAGVGSFTWTGHKGRLAIVEAIGNTSLATRLPFEEGVDYSRLYSDEANATANGKPLADDDPEWAMKHFVATYFRAMRHDRQVLFSHPPSRLQTLLWRLGHTGKLRYVPAVRTVIVPGIYQMEPYAYISSSVDEYMPEYINYGTLGALLSWELARIVTRGRGASRVGPVALESREDFARGRQRRKGTDDSYLDRLYCLLDLHSSLGFKHNVSGTPDEQHSEIFRRAQGVRLAYNALLANFRAASPDYDVFSTHWPDAQWAFFVRVCMVHCTADQTPRPLTPRERCLLPLHNMDEFAGAFECRTKPGFIRGSCLM